MLLEYNRLSTTEKNCYNQMLAAMNRYQTVFKFRAVDSKTVSKVFRAVLDDNPQVFWFTGAARLEQIERNGIVEETTLSATLCNNILPSSISIYSTRLQNIVDSIVSAARRRLSTFDKVLFVHDYIVDNTDYVMNVPFCYDAYGCLVNRRAVCSGYAKAFQLIMKSLGFNCSYVPGGDRNDNSIHSNHAWNCIQIDGEYYFIDTTWDDPKVDGVSRDYDNKSHNYFCITTSELLMTHSISREAHVPVCRGIKYNYYIRNRFYLPTYNFADAANIAERQLRNGNKFSIKFSSPAETNRAYTDLIDRQKVYSIRGMGNRISCSKSKSGLILTVNKR